MHWTRRTTLAILLSGGWALTACSDDGEPAASGGSGEDGIDDPFADEGGGPGDGSGEGLCAGACGSENCGSCPDGPVPVVISNYTIGSTEVTNSQYGHFLTVRFDPAYLAGLLPPVCASKPGFVPDQWPLNPAGDMPVVGVDWCDAAAYCAWSGQRLCGAIGGGPAMLTDVQNAASNEWYQACTAGGIHNYPYGLSYDGSLCNTKDTGYEQALEAGQLTTCEGGFAGLFDMSGNVWEWTNACSWVEAEAEADGSECRRRGGSYFSDGPNSRCAINSVRAWDFRSNNTGIRCCDSL